MTASATDSSIEMAGAGGSRARVVVARAPGDGQSAAQAVEAQRGDSIAVRARQPQPAPDLVGVASGVGHHGPVSQRFFLNPFERLLETARVNPDAELGLDERDQPARSHASVPGSVIVDEAQHLRGDLVRAARTARRRDQPLQPGAVERLDHAEAGGAGHAEARRRLGEGGLADPDQTNHLVAHLKQVASIEEVSGGEHRIADVVRRPVEGSCLPETVLLLGLIVVLCHGGVASRKCLIY